MTNSVRLFAPPMLSQSPGPRNLRNCENETPRRCLTLLTVTCPDDFPHDTNPTSCSQHALNLHLVINIKAKLFNDLDVMNANFIKLVDKGG